MSINFLWYSIKNLDNFDKLFKNLQKSFFINMSTEHLQFDATVQYSNFRNRVLGNLIL